MSKLSICENNWINIVFEGKNKEYGAYQLRKESDRTTLLAFFMGSMIVTSLISISMLINLFSTSEKIKIETPDYTDIVALREQQKRNLIATLLLSQGVPMILAGDELSHTQNGNNNTYCQDNELTWLNWELDDEKKKFLDLVRHAVKLHADQPE